MDEKNKLIPNQFAFRRDTSIENSVHNLFNQPFHAFDNGEFVNSSFREMTRAFDFTNRSKLWGKLYLHRLRDNENALLRGFLNSRIEFKNIGERCISVLPI